MVENNYNIDHLIKTASWLPPAKRGASHSAANLYHKGESGGDRRRRAGSNFVDHKTRTTTWIPSVAMARVRARAREMGKLIIKSPVAGLGCIRLHQSRKGHRLPPDSLARGDPKKRGGTNP